MGNIDFLSTIHRSTKRNYLDRINDPDFPKAKAATLAKRWDYDYWDGDRRINYGGYHYDGRWKAVAKAMADHYGLKPGERILDVGCGKGFLLYDLTQAVPGIEVRGLDISAYAIRNAKDEVREHVQEGNATALPFPDSSFDLVVSINTLHNLYCHELAAALREIERVGRQHKYICVESYRTEQEKANLLFWQVTCEAFNTPEEWLWWFDLTDYTGDHSFIFFE